MRRLSSCVLLCSSSFAVLAGACSGGGGAVAAVAVPPALTVVSQPPAAPIRLDASVLVVCSDLIDPASLAGDAVLVVAVDGAGLGTTAHGVLRVGAMPDHSLPGQVLEFEPALPIGEAGTDTGLQPDTGYELRLAAGGLRSLRGGALASDVVVPFRTVAAAAANERFTPRDFWPRVRAVAATPLDERGHWRLGLFGTDAPELRLTFDRALDSRAANLPRSSTRAAPGSVRLVYDDPAFGPRTVVDSEVELEHNAIAGAVVVMRPHGVLPNAAALRVEIDASLRGLAGEQAPTGSAAAVIAARDSETAMDVQHGVWVESFADPRHLDPDAGFAEPTAVIADGALQPGGVFAEDASLGDFVPGDMATVVNTAFAEVRLANGARVQVQGGVVHCRNLTIPAGYVVQGSGPNPLVFVVHGDAQIDGTIDVSGSGASLGTPESRFGPRGPGDAAVGSSLQAQLPRGAPGNCGGGDGGGSGSRSHSARIATGAGGFGPGQQVGGGGAGGNLACVVGCGRGSGGGGGSFATQGDPGYARLTTRGSFAQLLGTGGSGCAGAPGSSSRNLVGGDAGPLAFGDGRRDNDCFGVLFDPRRGVRVHGELPALRGGAGGGAGGDKSFDNCTLTSANFINDSHGGYGGGGGGVLVLQVRGEVTLGRFGHLRADGGNGCGGDQVRSSNEGGGGGGGSGGMVVVMAGTGITLHAHGETFTQLDYDFAISADGGVCATGTFSAPVVFAKYGPNGGGVHERTSYDTAPLGGFGGLGVIQLMVPVGADNADGTNTVLDDAITVVRDGLVLRGVDKMRYLAWGGLRDEQDHPVDDFGNAVALGLGEGDMRPSPVLMPVPFGTRSRARSQWLPLGAVARRPVAAGVVEPRAVAAAAAGGPEFAPLRTDNGWLRFREVGASLAVEAVDQLAQPAPVRSLALAMRDGRSVLAVELAAPSLAGGNDRYRGYAARLLGSFGEQRAALRVIAHDADTVWLEWQGSPPAGVVSLQVALQQVDLLSSMPGVVQSAREGMQPLANARLGFAFHRAIERARAVGNDPDRFPPQVGSFVRDWNDPAVAAALRAFGPTHLQWDVTLERAWRPTPLVAPAAPVDPQSAALRAMWLPFHF